MERKLEALAAELQQERVNHAYTQQLLRKALSGHDASPRRTRADASGAKHQRQQNLDADEVRSPPPSSAAKDTGASSSLIAQLLQRAEGAATTPRGRVTRPWREGDATPRSAVKPRPASPSSSTRTPNNHGCAFGSCAPRFVALDVNGDFGTIKSTRANGYGLEPEEFAFSPAQNSAQRPAAPQSVATSSRHQTPHREAAHSQQQSTPITQRPNSRGGARAGTTPNHQAGSASPLPKTVYTSGPGVHTLRSPDVSQWMRSLAAAQ